MIESIPVSMIETTLPLQCNRSSQIIGIPCMSFTSFIWVVRIPSSSISTTREEEMLRPNLPLLSFLLCYLSDDSGTESGNLPPLQHFLILRCRSMSKSTITLMVFLRPPNCTIRCLLPTRWRHVSCHHLYP